MIEILIPKQNFYDDVKNEFIEIKETKLKLEHSLISISKWEAKWHKSFLGSQTRPAEKTREEILDYISCMSISQMVDPYICNFIPPKELSRLIEYIENPMTATTFRENPYIGASKSSHEIITAETIYYWMIALNIPIEFQKWHLERLLTLIKVVSIKNAGPQKMNKRQYAEWMAKENQRRRAMYKTKG